MPQKPPYAPGQILGAFEIIALVREAVYSRNRLYQVRTLCCQQLVERTSHSLAAAARAEAGRCLACGLANKALPPRRAPADKYLPGMQVGPALVIAVPDIQGWRQVRWACCDKEELIQVHRLSVLSYRQARGQVGRCLDCDDAARRSPALTPESASRWMAASALLPPGVVSAAVAWPRPGVRA